MDMKEQLVVGIRNYFPRLLYLWWVLSTENRLDSLSPEIPWEKIYIAYFISVLYFIEAILFVLTLNKIAVKFWIYVS